MSLKPSSQLHFRGKKEYQLVEKTTKLGCKAILLDADIDGFNFSGNSNIILLNK